jgi:hypothetical protein
MSLDIDDTPAVARKEKKGKAKKTKPNERHRELIEWIVSHEYGTWDEEAGRLDTHTAALLEAVEALGLKGDFKTIVTGIRDIIEAPDLVSRTIKIDLPKIENRGREKDVLEAFEAARPKILGWLLDGVASALKHQADTKIDDLPRLADFCVWAQAAEPGLGLDQGSIVAAYREARKAAVSELLASNFAQAVLALADKGLDGTGKQPFGGVAQRREIAIRQRIGECGLSRHK